jgi:hypothetical protein
MIDSQTDIGISSESNNYKISLGEIRRVLDMELRNDSRLIITLDHNRADDSYLVALISNLIEVATPRDFVLVSETTGAPFDIAVLPDFSTRVWKQQLESSPVFGVLSRPNVSEIARSVTGISDNSSQALIPRGEYIPEFGDHIWLHRGKEIDALNLLGHPNVNSQSNLRFFEIWREPNTEMSLTDIILNNDLGVHLLEEFLSNDSIRMELV